MDVPEINAQMLAWLIVDLGALNWGLQEAFDFNLVTELLGTGSAGAVYMVIGVVAALSLAEKFEVVDVFEGV